MISRDHGWFTLTCDVCEEDAEETFDDFQDAVEFKREHGWKSQKTRAGWDDVCPDCRRKDEK